MSKKEPIIDDAINHPNHYTSGKIECIDGEREFLKDLEPFEAGLAFNMFKYIFRCEHKNGIEDVKKARWYYNKLKEYWKNAEN